jgi:hypothetical protein
MTGYCFAKILKYKEIDEIYSKKRNDKDAQKQRRANNQKKQTREFVQIEEQKGQHEKLPEPKDIENAPVNFSF